MVTVLAMSQRQRQPRKSTPLGNLIRDLRESMGLTQQQLGDEIGASKNAVGANERGENKPSMGTRKRYARAFGITFEDFERRWRTPNGTAGAIHRSDKARVPLINKTAAGKPRDYQDVGHNQYQWIELPPALVGDRGRGG